MPPLTAKEHAIAALDLGSKSRTDALVSVARFLQERTGAVSPVSLTLNGHQSAKTIRVEGVVADPPADSSYPVGLLECSHPDGDGFVWALEDIELSSLRRLVSLL